MQASFLTWTDAAHPQRTIPKAEILAEPRRVKVEVPCSRLSAPRSRPEAEGTDLWWTLNRVRENLIRGGVSDFHRDRRGKLGTARALRDIDSKVDMNRGLWALTERISNGETLPPVPEVALTA